MNEIEVHRQIEQMVMFIKQEAEEKANEIRVSAEEEFNLEKLNLMETEKQRIRKEYERREAQVEASKKIEASKQMNEQRLKILNAKQACIADVIKSARNDLEKITQNPAQYGALLIELLCQGMKKLAEGSQIVQCREEDVSIVERQLPAAQSKYKQVYKEEPPQLSLDRKHFLPAGAKAGAKAHVDDLEMKTCLGGVVLVSPSGRIVVNNTLDARLSIIQEEKLPDIRAHLFAEE